MRLELQKLRLVNIRTYKDATFTFQKGTNVIVGENGAGKSTILDSILFSLYNDTRTGINIVDLVRQGKRKAVMILNFNLDGVDYEVRTEINTYESKDGSLKANTKKIVAKRGENGRFGSMNLNKSTTGAKNVIYEVLGRIDSKLFSNMIYSQQGEIEKIATSKNSERRDLFYKILNLNQYTKASELGRDIVKIIKKEIQKEQEEIQKLTVKVEENKNVPNEVKELHEQKIKLEKKIKQKTKEYERFKKETDRLEELRNKKSMILGKLKNLKEELQREQANKQELEKRIKEKQKELHVPETEVQDVRKLVEEEYRKTEEEIKKITGEIEKIRSIKNRLEELHHEIEEKASIFNQIKQKIASLEKEILAHLQFASPYTKKQVQQLDVEIQKLEDEEKNLEAKRSDAKRIQGEFDEKLETIDSMKKKLSSIERQIKQLQEQIRKKINASSLEELNSLRQAMEEELQELEKQYQNVRNEISKIQVSRLETKKKQEELQEKRIILEKSKEPKCPVCGKALSLDGKRKLLNEWEEEENRIQETLKNLQAQESELQKTEKNLQKEKEKKQKQQKQLLDAQIIFEKIKILGNNKQEIEEELKKLNQEREQLAKQLTGFNLDELEQKLAHITEKEAMLRVHRDKLLQAISLQEQAKVSLAELEKKEIQFEELEKSLKEKDIDSLYEKEKIVYARRNVIQSLRETLNNLDTAKAKILRYEKELRQSQTELNKVNQEYSDEKYLDVKKKFGVISEEKAKFEENYRSIVKELLPEKEKLLQYYLRDKEELDELTNQVGLKQEALEAINMSRAILGDLPSKVTRSSLYNISHRASEILQQLLPDRDIVGIKLNDDFSIDIERGGGYEKIARLSGGEKVIIALSLRIALIEEFSDLGIMLWDEPTAALDDDRINKLIDVLEYQRPIAQLIVVTHREEFRKIADQTIVIERKPGESYPDYPSDEEA